MNRYQVIAQDDGLEADLARILGERDVRGAMALYWFGMKEAPTRLGITQAAMQYRWGRIQEHLKATGNPSLIKRILKR